MVLKQLLFIKCVYVLQSSQQTQKDRYEWPDFYGWYLLKRKGRIWTQARLGFKASDLFMYAFQDIKKRAEIPRWSRSRLHVCVPPKFICWNPNPQCNSIWSWGFWGVVRSWGWCPQDAILALIRYRRVSFLTSLHLWGGHDEKTAMCKPGRGPTAERNPTGILIWDFSDARTVRNTCFC